MCFPDITRKMLHYDFQYNWRAIFLHLEFNECWWGLKKNFRLLHFCLIRTFFGSLWVSRPLVRKCYISLSGGFAAETIVKHSWWYASTIVWNWLCKRKKKISGTSEHDGGMFTFLESAAVIKTLTTSQPRFDTLKNWVRMFWIWLLQRLSWFMKDFLFEANTESMGS